MTSVDSMATNKGKGIVGDINANPISPRQILITRKEDLDDLNIPYGGLRENMIVEGVPEEDFIPGALITINKRVRIKTTFYCEPCKRIADVVPSLKAVIRRRGLLGVILDDGEISIDDPVECIPNEFEPLSEIPYERFLSFVNSIPKGKVVTYKVVACAMGVAESFIRAMPKYIEKAITNNPETPVHRIVDESGSLIRYIPNQADLLQNENITPEINVEDNGAKVNLGKHLWH